MKSVLSGRFLAVDLDRRPKIPRRLWEGPEDGLLIACLSRIDRATVAALLVARVQGLEFGALRVHSL